MSHDASSHSANPINPDAPSVCPATDAAAEAWLTLALQAPPLPDRVAASAMDAVHAALAAAGPTPINGELARALARADSVAPPDLIAQTQDQVRSALARSAPPFASESDHAPDLHHAVVGRIEPITRRVSPWLKAAAAVAVVTGLTWILVASQDAPRRDTFTAKVTQPSPQPNAASRSSVSQPNADIISPSPLPSQFADELAAGLTTLALAADAGWVDADLERELDVFQTRIVLFEASPSSDLDESPDAVVNDLATDAGLEQMLWQDEMLF